MSCSYEDAASKIAELNEPILLALEEHIIEKSAHNIHRDKIQLDKEGQVLLKAILQKNNRERQV